jgi:hypothetical protein
MDISDIGDNLPTELDDVFIYPTELQVQPEGHTPLVGIFNRITTAYLTVREALSPIKNKLAHTSITSAIAYIKTLRTDPAFNDNFIAEPDPNTFLSDSDRRRLQADILRVDLHITIFACCARLLPALAEQEGDDVSTREREALYRDLALFMKSLPAWLVEPHAVVLVSFP